MNVYKYKSIDFQGNIRKGLYECENSQELLELIRTNGEHLLCFRPANKGFKSLLVRRISYEDISLFCSTFKTLIQAGVNILEALNLLSLELRNKALKENIFFITGEVKRGSSLCSSIEKCSVKFPTFLCEMVRVGEESGKLDEVLSELADHYYKENKFIKKIVTSMSYPVIVLIVTLISILILFTSVIPSLTQVLSDLSTELPWFTRLVISLSEFIRGNLIILLMLPVISFITFVLLYNRYKRSKLILNIIMSVPFVGRLYKNIRELQICRALRILLSGGVSILQAFEIIIETSKESYFTDRLNDIVANIREGYSLYDAVISVGLFSSLTVSLIRIGEETGKLEYMLYKLCDIMESNVENHIEKSCELIQPVLLLFISVIVGGVVAAVMIPMLNIASSI
jgi:type IV pilus assembly protein PilC